MTIEIRQMTAEECDETRRRALAARAAARDGSPFTRACRALAVGEWFLLPVDAGRQAAGLSVSLASLHRRTPKRWRLRTVEGGFRIQRTA